MTLRFPTTFATLWNGRRTVTDTVAFRVSKRRDRSRADPPPTPVTAGGPYLRGSEPDDGRQVFAFGRRQVPLLPEPALQLVRLRLAEQHAALAFLVHRRAVRRMAASAAAAATGRTRPVVVGGTGRGRHVVVELVVHLVRVRFRGLSFAADPGLGPAAAHASSDDAAAAAADADDRSVGGQPARRAGRVRQVRHARRRAVRAGLLRAVTDAETCGGTSGLYLRARQIGNRGMPRAERKMTVAH